MRSEMEAVRLRGRESALVVLAFLIWAVLLWLLYGSPVGTLLDRLLPGWLYGVIAAVWPVGWMVALVVGVAWLSGRSGRGGGAASAGRHADRRCAGCGYSLSALSPESDTLVCPECGRIGW